MAIITFDDAPILSLVTNQMTNGWNIRKGQGTFAPNLAGVWLLQQHQNAPLTGQRCARLLLCSAGRNHHVICDPRWTSSPLRSALGFRYTQWLRYELFRGNLTQIQFQFSEQKLKEFTGLPADEGSHASPRMMRWFYLMARICTDEIFGNYSIPVLRHTHASILAM